MESQSPHTHGTILEPPAGGTQRRIAPFYAALSALARVSVLTPRNGDIVIVGHPILIRWHTSCLAGLVLHHLQLSTDGGATYLWDIAPLLEGKDSHYLWIPTGDVVTEAARIRVRAVSWGEAVSDGLFSIQPADEHNPIPAMPFQRVALSRYPY
jgi:hypothetical protein